MTATDLLVHLAECGVTVRAVDDRLRVEAPQGTLTDEIRSALMEQKSALLELLRAPLRVRPHLCAGCKQFFFPEPATLCYWCRRTREQVPLGPPCDGCGEACEACLGHSAAMKHE